MSPQPYSKLQRYHGHDKPTKRTTGRVEQKRLRSRFPGSHAAKVRALGESHDVQTGNDTHAPTRCLGNECELRFEFCVQQIWQELLRRREWRVSSHLNQ